VVCATALFLKEDIMARKSRKHPQPITTQPNRDTVGYIRLSVRNNDLAGSIENQKRIIEAWGQQHQIPISHYYIDNGFSGRRFDRPAFQKMIQDIHADKIECIVVKDLSRLGRDYVEMGYYIEMLFPSKGVRFVSINDQFDTTDGMTNQNKDVPVQSSICIPLINLLNEQVAVDIKKKVEVTLDMKAQHGEFIGPRAPFGYQKSCENPNQLIPDPVAAITVRKIFELAAGGEGVTAIVRYLNERGLPTPIQYARSNGLVGNYDDGSGSWNSRSVKYILTNRTYTGMLVQGKEQRAVEATHEPLVNATVFDTIQKSFQDRAYDVTQQKETTENILKGKVICGCCGGKMQRKRGSNHANWFFFTCITKNRLGADKCTGMYIREEDIVHAVYQQLKDYVKEHFLSDLQYRQQMQEFNEQIADLSKRKTETWIRAMVHYERFIKGEISREEFQAVQGVADSALISLSPATKRRDSYKKQYAFRKLLSANNKEILLSEIMDYIEKITVDDGRQIVVEWVKNRHQVCG